MTGGDDAAGQLRARDDKILILATVMLDSGCFLPGADRGYTEIGYFGSSKLISDIQITVDGNNVYLSDR